MSNEVDKSLLQSPEKTVETGTNGGEVGYHRKEKDFGGHFLAAATFFGFIDMSKSILPYGLGGIAKVKVVPRPRRRRGRILDGHLDRHCHGGVYGDVCICLVCDEQHFELRKTHECEIDWHGIKCPSWHDDERCVVKWEC